jgi:hypothetical protein
MAETQSEKLTLSGAPNVKSVRAASGRAVEITWKGGAESTVDLSDLLTQFAVFAPLRRDDGRFGRVEVGEWGWCIRWSDEMEIASDTLWRLALDQGAAWLRDWRDARHMSQAEAAQALGVSPRLWRYYEAGSQLLPKIVRLAGIGFDALTRAA